MANSGGQAERAASRGTGCTERSGGSWADGVPKRVRGSAPAYALGIVTGWRKRLERLRERQRVERGPQVTPNATFDIELQFHMQYVLLMQNTAEEEVKEIFAYFGRAFYEAGVLETGLAMALLWSDFLAKVQSDYRAGGKTFNRSEYEAAFDAFLDQQHRQVMGVLIRRVTESTVLSDELKAKIQEANRRRNFLTHHFWRERAVDFSTPIGRAQLIVELNEEAEFFAGVVDELDLAMVQVRENVGIDEAALQRHVTEFMTKVAE